MLLPSSSGSRAVTLYRTLRRAHKRHLPTQMKVLGDTFIRNEFKLHKTANPTQIEDFIVKWEEYLQQLLTTARTKAVHQATDALDEQKNNQATPTFGRDMPHDTALSEDQLAQLEKLRKEADR